MNDLQIQQKLFEEVALKYSNHDRKELIKNDFSRASNMIGLNQKTLQRIYDKNNTNSNSIPALSTLDKLAVFIGHKNYSSFAKRIDRVENEQPLDPTLKQLLQDVSLKFTHGQKDWLSSQDIRNFGYDINMGISTIRRLFRYAKGTGNFNLSTKDILAEYLGFNSFYEYANSLNRANQVQIGANKNFVSKENYERIKRIGFSAVKNPVSFSIKHELLGVIGVKSLATEIIDLLKEMNHELGDMVGIFGRWGRGKTKLWKEIKSQLIEKKDKELIPIEFHAWKFQDTPALWAYLFEQFVNAYYSTAETGVGRIRKVLWLNIVRLGWSNVLWFILSFTLSSIWAFMVPFNQKLDWFVRIANFVSIGVILNLIIIYFRYGNTARKIYKKYTARVSYSHLLGIQSQLQNDLILLLKAWLSEESKERILLFVDDIDRCQEVKIIEIIDNLRILLDNEEISKKLIIIAAIDARILKLAIRYKYNRLGQPLTTNQLTQDVLIKEYMDKLFITSIRLAPLQEKEVEEIFDEVSKEHGDVEADLKLKFTEEQNSNQVIEQENDYNTTDELSEVKKKKKFTTVSNNEKAHLKRVLKNVPEITPREVKIFYYRYLLAKKLLYQRQKEGLTTIEINSLDNDLSALPFMILHYSQPSKLQELESDKRVNKEKKSNQIFISILGYDQYLINRNLYFQLLPIVEMVVAY